MATSFISERSAELSVIPYLKVELEKYFDNVAPVFPWLNREFSNISKEVHAGDKFKTLAVFPRRPKLESGKDEVFVTINDLLLDFKEFASEYGIPVIAGCPVSTTFWGLSKGAKTVWIDINEKTNSRYLYRLRDGRGKVRKGLSVSTIVKRVRRSPKFDFQGFRNFVQSSRYEFPYRLFFGPQYKPTYLLIK